MSVDHLRERITPAVLDAYRRNDYEDLHAALGLADLPHWHRSPLPITSCDHGVDQLEPPRDDAPGPWRDSWYVAREMQAAIEAALREAGDGTG